MTDALAPDMQTASEQADRTLLYTPATDLEQLISRGDLSPLTLMEALLRRIERLDQRLGSYVTVCDEMALDAARVADRAVQDGAALGPLHGIPVSVKDTTNTAGIRTTSGSRALQHYVPDTDAIVVRRLKAAGAIVVGKTNVPEFANAFSAENDIAPPTRNPWDATRSCSGSSSGAAASVAAGLGPLAMGTDGGGSIRAPAAFCGVFGLKPSTIGTRVPFDTDPASGLVLDFCTHGPLTRTVADAALVMSVISGAHPADYNCMTESVPDFLSAASGSTGPLRIAWSPTLSYLEGPFAVEPNYLAVVREAVDQLAQLGHHVDEVDPPTWNPIPSWERIVATQVLPGIAALYDEHRDELMSYNTRFVEFARGLTGAEVCSAYQDAARARARLAAFFADYDVLVAPTSNSVPFAVGAIFDRDLPDGCACFDWDLSPATPMFNLTGNPAASVPVGFVDDRLPVGLQVAGRHGDEMTVLQVCADLERVRPWVHALPTIS